MKVWFLIYALSAATASFLMGLGNSFGYSGIFSKYAIIGLGYWGSMSGAWVGSMVSLLGIIGLFLNKSWAGRAMTIGILGFSLSVTVSVVTVLWVGFGEGISGSFIDILVESLLATGVRSRPATPVNTSRR